MDRQPPINIYMPGIFWHDRQGILSIDILQQQSSSTTTGSGSSTNNTDDDGNDEVQVYKIATASMQKEIRVWNFRFERVKANDEAVEKKKSQTTAALAAVVEAQKMEASVEEQPKAEQPHQNPPTPMQLDEDSIVFVDPEKENLNSNETPKKRRDMDVEIITGKVGELGNVKNPQLMTTAVMKNSELSVEFLANLEGHRITTNVVRFSPNGIYLASGDVDGTLLVWTLAPWPEEHQQQQQLQQQKDESNGAETKTTTRSGEDVGTGAKEQPQQQAPPLKKSRDDPELDIPPNKENWVRAFRSPVIRHDGDVTGLCFSPDSQLIASVSMDDSIAVHRADNGKRLWVVRNFRHFANGVIWDPLGKYLITMSTDRRMDILDTRKGTRLRCCHQIELPITRLQNGIEIGQQSYKLFHDDQLISFQRGVDISPCGSIVFAPAAHLEVEANNIYGTLAFERSDLTMGRPTALFPTLQPTIQVKCSPIMYQLEEGPNMLRLPYRLVFAVLCRDSILLYNTQRAEPFAYLENLHYDKLTACSWTPDGRVLVVSSLEGFCSFITVGSEKLGTPYVPPIVVEEQQQVPQQDGEGEKKPEEKEPVPEPMPATTKMGTE